MFSIMYLNILVDALAECRDMMGTKHSALTRKCAKGRISIMEQTHTNSQGGNVRMH